MAEELQALTGLPEPEAQALLKAHGGDPNRAAAAFFDAGGSDEGGQSGDEGAPLRPQSSTRNVARDREGAPSQPAGGAVERLLADTAARTQAAAEAAAGAPSAPAAPSRGRKLNETHSPAAAPEEEAPREVHAAFFKDALVFYEPPAPQPPAPGKAPRHTGLHTIASSAGPYPDHPELSWIGDMTERLRVMEADPRHARMVADMQANVVPDLPFLREGRPNPARGPRVAVSLVLHDHRQLKAMHPANQPVDDKRFQGTGHTLAGPGGSGGGGGAGRAAEEDAAWRAQAGLVGGLAVLAPALLSRLGVHPHLGHSVLGAAAGYVIFHGASKAIAAATPPEPKFSVDPALPTTKIKFRFESATPWTEEFNPTVHTLRTLHRVVAEHCLEPADAQRELKRGKDAPATLQLSCGYPRRVLDPDDDSTTLAVAGVENESIVVTRK